MTTRARESFDEAVGAAKHMLGDVLFVVVMLTTCCVFVAVDAWAWGRERLLALLEESEP